jgi:hypothetical protein
MSAIRTTANINRGSQYFVNTVALTNTTGTTSDFFGADGVGIAIDAGEGVGSAGLVLVRDMGKTIRLPANTGGSFGLRTLRKVQRVRRADVSTTNDGVTSVAGSNPQYGVCYIDLGINNTALNGTHPIVWASLTLPTPA